MRGSPETVKLNRLSETLFANPSEEAIRAMSFDAALMNYIGSNDNRVDRFRRRIAPLLARNSGEPEYWKIGASCRDLNNLMFVPESREERRATEFDSAAIRRVAQAVCSACVVRSECLTTSESLIPGAVGVWGGKYYPIGEKSDNKEDAA